MVPVECVWFQLSGCETVVWVCSLVGVELLYGCVH